MGRVDPGIVEHLAVARRHLGKAVLAGLVAAIAVLAVRGGERRAYEATADVRLALVDPGGTPADEAEFHAETYSRLAKSPSVVAAAARSAGLDLTPAEAARRLDATVLDAPGFVAVTASAEGEEEATRFADAYVATLVAAIGRDQTELAGVGGAPQVVARAASTRTAVRPGAAGRLAAVAGIVATIVAVEVAIGLRWLRGRMWLSAPAAHATEVLGVPATEVRRRGATLLASEPFLTARVADHAALAVAAPSSRAAMLAASALTSAAERRGWDTLLAESALEPASMTCLAAMQARPGFAEFVAGDAALAEVAARVAEHVAVVPAGEASSPVRPERAEAAVGWLVAASGARVTLLSVGEPTERFAGTVVSRPGVGVLIAFDPLTTNGRELDQLASDIVDLGGSIVGALALPAGSAGAGRWPWRRTSRWPWPASWSAPPSEAESTEHDSEDRPEVPRPSPPLELGAGDAADRLAAEGPPPSAEARARRAWGDTPPVDCEKG